jgi:hypothetical protein
VRADPTASVSIATGQYGFRKEVPHALGLELQVHPPWRWSLIRPTVGILANSNGGAYVFTGIVVAVPLPLSLQLSPGFAPGVMLANNNSGGLGSPIEFRSSIELSYAPRDAMRMGISFMHLERPPRGSQPRGGGADDDLLLPGGMSGSTGPWREVRASRRWPRPWSSNRQKPFPNGSAREAQAGPTS